MAEHKPLYRKTLEHARALGEISQWRESRKENIACARAIDKAIAEGYDGMHLREGIPAEIVQQFGMDRVAWVLATTLHEKEHDGRFTYGNKVWGEAQRISHDNQAYEYCCNAHPVLVNDLIDDFRKLQREAVQTPETLRIRIFQINHDRDPERRKFMDLEHLGGKPVDASSYDRVFTGEIPGKTLEDVFQVFNTGGHRLHRGHSLSVSDIVELRDPAGDTPAGFYYCDSVGFQPVDFDPDKAQVPDRLCRILVLEPHRRPYESELVDELSNLQRAVGGLIEFTYPFDDNTIVCGNEEAKLEGQEGNRRIYGSVYAGNLFLVGDDGEGGLTSLTDEQIEKYSEMFAQPEDISQEEVEADTGFIFYGF
ncbi:MAG: DUF3849 domain-containing protein [Oscillospiraceae bacterium]|nr:DUF3849 domain-containing protein [Oscillospiraceae bacterium]